MKLKIIGESHMEYFIDKIYLNLFLKDLNEYPAIKKQFRNDEGIQKYDKITDKFLIYINEFYKNELILNEGNNILFVEGNLSEERLEEMLELRKINKYDFSEILFLDEEDYWEKIHNKDYLVKERENKIWSKKLENHIRNNPEANIFCIVGKNHVRKDSKICNLSFPTQIIRMKSKYEFENELMELFNPYILMTKDEELIKKWTELEE